MYPIENLPRSISALLQNDQCVTKEEGKAAQIARRLHDQFYGGNRRYRLLEYILPRNLVLGSNEHVAVPKQ